MREIDKKVLYCGSDQEYLNKLEDFYYNRLISSTCKVDSIKEYELNNLYVLVLEKLPHLIIVDFSHDDMQEQPQLEMLAHQLYLLKKNPLLKGIAVVGLFLNQEMVWQQLSFISTGMSYFFIKGSENVFSLLDSFYIAFEQNIPIPHFAKAQNLELAYPLQFLSAIVNCSSELITLESDLELEEQEQITVYNRLVDNHMPPGFEIDKREQFTDNFFFYRYQLKIPFCGAWDEPDETNIMSDTYETWLEFAQEDIFTSFNGRMLFVGQDEQMLKEVGELSLHYSAMRFYIMSSLDLDILYSRPNIIFMQLAVQEEDDHLYQDVAQIVHTIGLIPDYHPLIVLFSSPSTRDALEKTYGYSNFVTSTTHFSKQLVDTMLQKAQKFFAKQNKKEFDLPLISETAQAAVVRSAQITSLTEHYITFYAEKDIPMYSLVQLEVPVKMLVTLIPPIDFLPGKESLQHYQGVINGITVEQRAVLRRFVNFLIHKRPNEFAWVEPEQEEEQSEDEQNSIDSDDTSWINEAAPVESKGHILGDTKKINQNIRQRKYDGKSKL